MKIINFIKDSTSECAPFSWGLTLFCYGCNLCCEMCKGYNYEKVTNRDNIIGSAIDIISQNITPIHDCVVFIGGEPTVWGESLKEALRYCHEHNLKTKIFSNGVNTDLIKEINEEGLCDAWSIDFKGVSHLEEQIGMKGIEYSIKLDDTLTNIIEHKLPLEIRTTFYEGNEKDKEQIISTVEGHFINPYKKENPTIYAKFIEQYDMRDLLKC